MRVKSISSSIHLWASRRDTYDWAHRPGKLWPCSTLSGKSLFVALENSGADIADILLDGREDTTHLDWHELRCFLDDMLCLSQS